VSPSRGHIRTVLPDDLDRLVEIENASFPGDRLSRRSLRRLAARSTAEMVVVESGGAISGYALVLFHSRRGAARLYSIAVDAAFAGKGLGSLLLAASEDRAKARGAGTMRLEVRQDNDAAQSLYRAAGYRQTGAKAGYYSDGTAALTFEKVLL
jgi:ribosomal-protein-alanine acetyltransferase